MSPAQDRERGVPSTSPQPEEAGEPKARPDNVIALLNLSMFRVAVGGAQQQPLLRIPVETPPEIAARMEACSYQPTPQEAESMEAIRKRVAQRMFAERYGRSVRP